MPDFPPLIDELFQKIRWHQAQSARLQDLLDCEQGKRAPEGWEWQGSEWVKGKYRVQWLFTPGVPGTHSWSYLDDGWTTGRYFTYALEAIEAAMAKTSSCPRGFTDCIMYVTHACEGCDRENPI